MNKLNKLLLLTAVSSLLGIQSAQARSTFSADSNVTITIDSITNNTHAGDHSDLDIYGLFEIGDALSAPGFGKDATGDGDSNYSHIEDEIDSSISPINAGDSFSQVFSSLGSVNNGYVDAYYQAFGGLEFVNNSSDSFTIKYSLSYDLNALVTKDGISDSNFATNTVVLEYFNDLGDIEGYEEAAASTLLDLSAQNLWTESFTLNLDAVTKSDKFFADVSINGYARAESPAPVPIPATIWLMLSGLAFLRNFRKSAI